MPSYKRFVFGNLQLFGKIILKHFFTIQHNFQHNYNQASQNSASSLSSLSSATSASTPVTTKTKALAYPSSKVLISSILAFLSTSLTLYFVPELLGSVYSNYLSHEHRRNRPSTSIPTSACSSPHVTILTPSTLHKYATTYTPPITINPNNVDTAETKPQELIEQESSLTYHDSDSPAFRNSDSPTTYQDLDPATAQPNLSSSLVAPTPTPTSSPQSLEPQQQPATSSSSPTSSTSRKPIFSMVFSSINTNTLFFPGTCRRSAFLVFIPDPMSDLVLDVGPLIESTFKEYMEEEELIFEEDEELSDIFNVYLFEEDELEMKRLRREKTFSWKITIPRPPESAALPRPKFLPGQERELGKGWRYRRQGQWHGQGYYCLGGKPWDVMTEYGLRHWIASLNEPTSLRHNRVVQVGNAQGEWMRYETFETEPKIASLVRSINKLDALVTS
ncbi:hypothetical protein BGZ76_009509 [Entomortierella beljakovae]|nr:hypothetical protein BGZ76_009509 [Entomortierella beljakovae]